MQSQHSTASRTVQYRLDTFEEWNYNELDAAASHRPACVGTSFTYSQVNPHPLRQLPNLLEVDAVPQGTNDRDPFPGAWVVFHGSCVFFIVGFSFVAYRASQDANFETLGQLLIAAAFFVMLATLTAATVGRGQS
jgi:hypothetical protein